MLTLPTGASCRPEPARRGFSLFPATALLALIVAGTASQAAAQAADGALVQRLIVRFETSEAAGRRQIGAAHQAMLERLVGQAVLPQRRLASGADLLRLRQPVARAEADRLAAAIATQPGVRYAQPDYRRHIAQSVVPSDPDFFRQWYLAPVDATNPASTAAQSGWDVTTGANGSQPVIAVLDSGIRPHPELVSRLAADGSGPEGYDFISADQRSDGSQAFLTANDGDGRDSTPVDPGDFLTQQLIDAEPDIFSGCTPAASSWHGTAVGGIIAAAPDTESDGEGTVGLHFDARILPVRVLGRCGGYVSDIVDGIRWAAGQSVAGVPDNTAAVRVINLSFGASGTCTAEEQSAIDAAIDAGILVVAAAGNQGANAGGFAPGNCRGVLTVAATTRAGARASYTNFDISSDVVDLAAPGGDGNLASTADDIFAPTNLSNRSPGEEGFAFFAGTSFSAPMVSGAAALLISLNPRLSPSCLYDDLLATARAFPSGVFDACTTDECGAGLLDVEQALRRVDDRGPGDCGSTSLLPGGSSDDGGSSGAGLWLVLLLAGAGFTRRFRAGWWKPPCRLRSPASCRRTDRRWRCRPG